MGVRMEPLARFRRVRAAPRAPNVLALRAWALRPSRGLSRMRLWERTGKRRTCGVSGGFLPLEQKTSHVVDELYTRILCLRFRRNGVLGIWETGGTTRYDIIRGLGNFGAGKRDLWEKLAQQQRRSYQTRSRYRRAWGGERALSDSSSFFGGLSGGNEPIQSS